VFCRHALASLLADVLRDLDYDDPDRARALVDALKHELPESWHAAALRGVTQGQPQRAAVLARVIGYQRLDTGGALAALAAGAPPETQEALLWAIGRTRENGGEELANLLCAAPDERVSAAAVRTALRLHDPRALPHIQVALTNGRRFAVDAALGGDRSVTSKLVGLLRESRDPETCVALGLVGDLSAVRLLVETLAFEPLAAAAAEALYVITGAPLFETVLIEDQLTEDELFDKELRTFRETGELPKRGDGQPFGTNVSRLSQDPMVWEKWLQANGSRFKADWRYRVGQPYSPSVLFECLRSETFPKSYRALVGEELLVRYRIDLPFEADMPVEKQQAVLGQGQSAISAAAPRFEAGRWYTFEVL
jgi:hypothetical protein